MEAVNHNTTHDSVNTTTKRNGQHDRLSRNNMGRITSWTNQLGTRRVELAFFKYNQLPSATIGFEITPKNVFKIISNCVRLHFLLSLSFRSKVYLCECKLSVLTLFGSSLEFIKCPNPF